MDYKETMEGDCDSDFCPTHFKLCAAETDISYFGSTGITFQQELSRDEIVEWCRKKRSDLEGKLRQVDTYFQAPMPTFNGEGPLT
jgi:hypothetical protein